MTTALTFHVSSELKLLKRYHAQIAVEDLSCIGALANPFIL